MFRRLTLLICLVLAYGLFNAAEAATPSIVQWASGPNSGNTNRTVANPTYTLQFPEPTQSGNLLIVVGKWDNGASPTPSVSDDKSNTWNVGCSHVDVNSNTTKLWYALNSVSGTRKVTLTMTSSSSSLDVSMHLVEATNIASASAIDGCLGNDATGTSITSGSVTPTVSNDLVVNFILNAQSSAHTTVTSGTNSNITWAMLANDDNDSIGIQWGIYSSTSAMNPAATTASSHTWTSMSAFFKNASQGSGSSQSLRVLGMQHQQMPASHANPFTTHFGFQGNLVVVQYHGGGDTISSISSTTPTATGTCGTAKVQSGDADQYCYFANLTPGASPMALSITMSATTNNGTFMLYDITGAATSPFDVDSGGTAGTLSTMGPLTVCSSCLTPTTTSGIVIASEGHAFCTSTAISAPTGGLFDSAVYLGNSLDGPEPVDQNNGWLHYYNTNTNAVSETFTETCSSQNLGNWTSMTEHFLAPGAATAFPTSSLGLMGVGR